MDIYEDQKYKFSLITLVSTLYYVLKTTVLCPDVYIETIIKLIKRLMQTLC